MLKRFIVARHIDLSAMTFVSVFLFEPRLYSIQLFISPANFRELLLESFLVGTLGLPKEAALTPNAISRVLGPSCATAVLLT